MFNEVLIVMQDVGPGHIIVLARDTAVFNEGTIGRAGTHGPSDRHREINAFRKFGQREVSRPQGVRQGLGGPDIGAAGTRCITDADQRPDSVINNTRGEKIA